MERLLQFCGGFYQAQPTIKMTGATSMCLIILCKQFYSRLPANERKPLGAVCVAAPLRVPLHKRRSTITGCKQF